MIRRNDRSVFFGIGGSGKTQLARAFWIGFASPRVVIDVKDDLAEYLPGVPTIDAPSEVLDHQTVRAVPPAPGDRAWYDELYRKIFVEGDTLCWLDEANEVTSSSFIPEDMRRFVLQGRGRNCGHMACTPRPADIHPSLRAQANQIFVFHLQDERDRAAVTPLLGVDRQTTDTMLASLPRYGFVHRDVEERTLKVLPSPVDVDELTARIGSLYFGPYE